jgi:hypothetical protein
MIRGIAPLLVIGPDGHGRLRIRAGGRGHDGREQVKPLEETSAIIALLRPLIVRIVRRDHDLGSQLRRAASGVGVSLAEGFGCRAGNARAN